MGRALDDAELLARWFWRQNQRGVTVRAYVRPWHISETGVSIEGPVTGLGRTGGGHDGKQFTRYSIKIGENGGILLSPNEVEGFRIEEWDEEVASLKISFKNTDYIVEVRDPHGRGDPDALLRELDEAERDGLAEREDIRKGMVEP
jgi:hypothetical protein